MSKSFSLHKIYAFKIFSEIRSFRLLMSFHFLRSYMDIPNGGLLTLSVCDYIWDAVLKWLPLSSMVLMT